MASSSSSEPAPPPPPFSSPQPYAAAAAATAANIPRPLMLRCHLQTFARRMLVGDPVYQTVYEGTSNDPKFRATVWVDGKSYTTHHTYSRRRVAEDEAARLALESLTKNMTQEGASLLVEIFSLCKSIVNEYAMKLNLERPTYNTVRQEGVVPTFISSLVFNGSTYVGEAAYTKKDAEKLAARAVILSNLGNSDSGIMLFLMIKAKYNATKRNNSLTIHASGASPSPVENPGHTSNTLYLRDKEVSGPAADYNNGTKVDFPESSRLLSSCHELQMPAVSLQPGLGRPINYGLSSKKRRKNEEKPNKKPRLESPLPAGFFLWHKSLLAQQHSDNVDM